MLSPENCWNHLNDLDLICLVELEEGPILTSREQSPISIARGYTVDNHMLHYPNQMPPPLPTSATDDDSVFISDLLSSKIESAWT